MKAPAHIETMAPTVLRDEMKEADPYRARFECFEREAAGRGPAWLLPIRRAGLARFSALGFPTTRDEDWRFTNVAPLVKRPFRPVLEPPTAELPEKSLQTFAFAGLPGSRLVFVNGHYAPALSRVLPQKGGVQIGSLAAALAAGSAVAEQHLARHASAEHNAFTALNTAFFQDGAFIHVPPGQAVEEPVQLVFVTTARETGATTQPRNLIVADRLSRLTVLESQVSLVEAPYFTNAVTELLAGEGAVVEHCKYQDESLSAFHVAAVHLHLGRSANVIWHSIANGAKLSRNNITTVLAGEGIECVLNGLYLTRQDQLADHHMVVEHARPHCNSHEYFNGILDDRSRGVFHGRILVRPVAQKTDAKQTNKNLLLSDAATIDTKPQLEIYADDVRCTHGATVGQLNEESIFYLRARGIGLETARRMLIHAFAGEIIERIRCEPMREELDQIIWERLEQNPHLAGAAALPEAGPQRTL